jgi:ribonuclease-3
MNPADAQLEARIDHAFRDRSLLERALTHSSLLPELASITESNQRLEFLGDAVLQLVLTEALFTLYSGEREGILSKRRAALANGAYLARLAREIGLDFALRLSANEEAAGGRSRAAALEDAFEALVGAVYLDGDYGEARRVVLGIYGPLEARLATVEEAENPKGRLQEIIQPLHGNNALRYDVVRIAGEDHSRRYEVSVFLLDRLLGTGSGSSKKSAEEAAAREALNMLHLQ